MKCLKLEQIYNYLEGELSPQQRKEVEEHLSFCSKCYQAVEERKFLLESIGEIPKFEPPSNFVEKVMAKIAISEVSWIKVLISSISASFIFLLILFGLLKITGQSISSLFLTLSHSFLNIVENTAIIIAKIIRIITLIVWVIKQLFTHFLTIISHLASSGVEFQVVIFTILL